MHFPFYSRLVFISKHDEQTTRNRIESLSHQMEVNLSDSKICLIPNNDLVVRGASLFRVRFSGQISKQNENVTIDGAFRLSNITLAIILIFLWLFTFQIIPLLFQFSLTDVEPIGAALVGMLIVIFIGAAVGIFWLACADTSKMRQAIESALQG